MTDRELLQRLMKKSDICMANITNALNTLWSSTSKAGISKDKFYECLGKIQENTTEIKTTLVETHNQTTINEAKEYGKENL